MRTTAAIAALVLSAQPAVALEMNHRALDRMGLDLAIGSTVEPMQNHLDGRAVDERRGELRAGLGGGLSLALTAGDRGVGAQLILPDVAGWEVRAGALAGGEGGMVRLTTPFSF